MLEELSAERLHEALLRAHAAGNRARLAFIETLATLYETGLYVELGCPNIVVYGERCFGYRKSETYECLRVHEAVGLLRRLAEAFATGQLSWSQLREITRVATPQCQESGPDENESGQNGSEAQWIAFARAHTVAELRAEVKDAGRSGRDRPRDDGGGLPNLDVKFTVDLTRSEHHALSTALEKIAREMSERIGGERVEVRHVLLHMAETVLASEPGGTPEGRHPRSESHHALLYRVCPRCRNATLATEEGAVSIDLEQVQRVAPAARVEVIAAAEEEAGAGGRAHVSAGGGSAGDYSAGDYSAGDGSSSSERDRPNPPRLRRQLIFREGLVCANPHCRARVDHGHHILPRSRGGRTELYNEAAVCARCHALIHAGLLAVDGDPTTGLTWSTRSDRAGGAVTERLAAELQAAPPSSFRMDPVYLQVESEPSVRPVESEASVRPVPHGSAAGNSARAETSRLTTTTPRTHVRKSYKSLTKALVRLGYDREEAEDALVSALTRLHERGEAVTEERLVQLALCPNA